MVRLRRLAEAAQAQAAAEGVIGADGFCDLQQLRAVLGGVGRRVLILPDAQLCAVREGDGVGPQETGQVHGLGLLGLYLLPRAGDKAALRAAEIYGHGRVGRGAGEKVLSAECIEPGLHVGPVRQRNAEQFAVGIHDEGLKALGAGVELHDLAAHAMRPAGRAGGEEKGAEKDEGQRLFHVQLLSRAA